MEIKDRVYGEFSVSEPVILELLRCPTVLRLKNIDQVGYREPYFPNSSFSRSEHSAGVFLLLRKYGAPIEEQIAGLIHDVSHSAFSHCIDYVLTAGSEKEQSHQDNVFEAFVIKSEIPAILERHGFDVNYILDDTHFPLEETKLPELCADRIDYSLRDALVLKEKTKAEVLNFLANLETRESKWVFKDFETAKEFALMFSKLNATYWAGLPTALMFRTVGDYLRHALVHGYISETDLYNTDKAVLSKIKKFHGKDDTLKTLFDRMNKPEGKYKIETSDGDLIFCKSRAVDPLCRHGGELKRVSEIDPVWAKTVLEELKPKQYSITFVR